MDVGLSVAPALVFGTGMFFLPETPRWLMHGGHHEVAPAFSSESGSLPMSTSRSMKSRRAWRNKLKVDTGPICCVGKFAQLLSLD